MKYIFATLALLLFTSNGHAQTFTNYKAGDTRKSFVLSSCDELVPWETQFQAVDTLMDTVSAKKQIQHWDVINIAKLLPGMGLRPVKGKNHTYKVLRMHVDGRTSTTRNTIRPSVKVKVGDRNNDYRSMIQKIVGKYALPEGFHHKVSSLRYNAMPDKGCKIIHVNMPKWEALFQQIPWKEIFMLITH